jgi:hypothetical protein
MFADSPRGGVDGRTDRYQVQPTLSIAKPHHDQHHSPNRIHGKRELTCIMLTICSLLFCGLSLSDSNNRQSTSKFGDGFVLMHFSGRSRTSDVCCAAASRRWKDWEKDMLVVDFESCSWLMQSSLTSKVQFADRQCSYSCHSCPTSEL